MKKWFSFFYAFCLVISQNLYATSIEISTTTKKILVNGKEATVLALSQPDGTLGLRTKKGDPFDVVLKNTMKVPTSIHWHGLILPNEQDGVAFITQFPIYPGLSYRYKFPLIQSGTYWMHSHFGLQEQQLLSAPLIITDPEDQEIADRDAVLFLADFSFKTPEEIYEQLRCNKKTLEPMSMMKMSASDLVDVDYDAFLLNYRTLDNPDIVKVGRGNKVRLRVINGASSTNFFINLGKLEGDAIAVDGNRIKPIQGSQFELAVAQRIDIVVTIPQEGDLFPVIAQGEGTDKLAGIILTTKEMQSYSDLSEKSPTKAKAFSYSQEMNLHALSPLPSKPVDQQVILELGGDMSKYIWTINGRDMAGSNPYHRRRRKKN